MNDPIRELKLLLADVIERLAATDTRINALTLSVLALQGAVRNCDSAGRFDVQYEKVYKVEAARLKDQSDAEIVVLLEAARELQKEN